MIKNLPLLYGFTTCCVSVELREPSRPARPGKCLEINLVVIWSYINKAVCKPV